MDPFGISEFPSPDWRHRVRFTYEGEVRFGPPYFTVALDGRLLRRWLLKRHFGSARVWSPDSRYLALQEWYELAEQPDTEVRLIDVIEGRECSVARAQGALAEPLRFDDGVLVLAVDRFGPAGLHARREERVNTGGPHAWRRIGFVL